MAAGVAGYFYYTQYMVSAEVIEEPALQTTTVRKGDIVITAVGNGTLMPGAEIDLGFRSGGTLAEFGLAQHHPGEEGAQRQRHAEQLRRAVVVRVRELVSLGAELQRAVDELNATVDGIQFTIAHHVAVDRWTGGAAESVERVADLYAARFAVSSSGELRPVLMTVLGGSGIFFGPLFGSAIFFGLEQVITSMTENWMVFLGIILVPVVVFFPHGILGSLIDWIRTRTTRTS